MQILNFSIAYGKTAMGLSKDWNVSLAEAKDTVAKWYGDRPEVFLCIYRVILLVIDSLGIVAGESVAAKYSGDCASRGVHTHTDGTIS